MSGRFKTKCRKQTRPPSEVLFVFGVVLSTPEEAKMEVGSTFSRAEIEQILREEGLKPGSQEWRSAFSNRFYPTDGESDTWAELPDVPMTSAVTSRVQERFDVV